MQLVAIDGSRSSSLFGGMCKITGRWSEFRLVSISMVDVYVLGF